jgi:hypothetical protein
MVFVYSLPRGLFEEAAEPEDFLMPEAKGVRFSSRIGQVHKMERFDAPQKLVHLFLAVAGRLSDQKIACREKRACIGNSIAIARFNQRAQVGRKGPLRIGDRFFPLAAKADWYRSSGPHNLNRCKQTVNARHFLPFILQFGNVEQKALTSILKLFETIRFQMKSPLALAAEGVKNQTGAAAPYFP